MAPPSSNPATPHSARAIAAASLPAPGGWLEHFRPPVVSRLSAVLTAVRTLGLPWAPGVAVRAYDAPSVVRQARGAVTELERLTGYRFGTKSNPLVLTVQDPAPGSCLDPSRCVGDVRSMRRLEEVLTAAARGWTASGATPEVLVRLSLDAIAPVDAVGVACTRDPLTGAPGLNGECRPVAGGEAFSIGAMRNRLPAAYATLERAVSLLEARYRQVCTLEFTTRGDELAITSGSIGVPAVEGALRIVVDLVDEGVLSPSEALEHVPLRTLEAAQRPVVSSTGSLVDAQPDLWAARVLAWCSDLDGVAVVDEVPSGFAAVQQLDSVRSLEGAPGHVLDPPPTAAPVEWAMLVTNLVRTGTQALAVVYNHAVDQVTPSLPAAPWTHVVAEPAQTWPAQVLAARLAARRWQPPPLTSQHRSLG